MNPTGLEPGPCPTANAIGCCVGTNGVVSGCAYDLTSAQLLWHGCMAGYAWPDGGDAGAAASRFVGTWTGSPGLEQLTSCSANGSAASALVNQIVVTLGPNSPVIVETGGCGSGGYYSVNDNVATDTTPDRGCYVATEAGVELINVVTDTLTLSADGSLLTWTSTVNITVQNDTGMTCTATASGSFMKM